MRTMEIFIVEMSLSDVTEVDVTAIFSLTSGTATIGTDVTNLESPNNKTTISRGQTTGTFSIPIIADSALEGPESFTLAISAIGATVATGNSSKSITIVDGETPKIEINPDVDAINEDARDVFVYFRVRGTITESFSFNVLISSGTAITSVDLLPRQTTVSFNTNTTVVPILVSIISDQIVEDDETFILTLSDLTSSNVQLPNGETEYTKTITIIDDDSRILSVTNDTLTVSENVTGGEFVLNVELSKVNNSLPVTFDFSVESDSATETSDYTVPTNRRVTIEAGSRVGSFSIPIIEDSIHEGNETFKIFLRYLNGAAFADGEVNLENTITIIDDEYPTVELPTTELTVHEDDSNIAVSVTLSGPSNRTIAVNYVTENGSAIMGEDFTHQQGTLKFSAGTTEKSFTIPILEDSSHEGEETFDVQFTISIGSAIFEGGATTATKSIVILDNESPTLSIANTEFHVSEDVGSSGYRLEFAISGPVRSGTVAFNFAVNGGTAVEGVDYSVSNQQVWISAGGTKKRLSITIYDDTMIEGNKTIRFTLTNLTGAVFVGEVESITRTITIVDDERTTLSLTTTDFEVDEDVSTSKFDIGYALSPASPFDVTFMVSTIDGTAVKSQDYTELAMQTVTIAAGSTTGTISIQILEDADIEGEESFTVKIEKVVGAVVTENNEVIEKTVTIIDDEASTIILDDILNAENIIEGYGDYEMNFGIKPEVNSPISIRFSTAAVTATSGTDYMAPGNQTFVISRDIPYFAVPGFSIPDNSTRDGDKTFTISLEITSGSAVFLGGMTRKEITMTIVDDESFLVSTWTDVSRINEDVGDVLVYYSLSKTISSTITFNAALSDGAPPPGYTILDSQKGADYEDLQNSTITIPPGQRRGSFAISIIDDSETEYEEGFTLRLTNLTNAVFSHCNNCNSRAKEHHFYIRENDDATISFEKTEYFVEEDVNGAQFVINLILSDDTTPASRYNIEFTDGTARNGVEYSYSSSLLNRQRINHNETMRTIPITIRYNPSYTGNKTFQVSLIRPLRLNFPDDAETVYGELKYSRTITIIDSQAPPINITTTDFTVAENVSGGNLLVNYTLDNPATHQVSFNYDMIDLSTIKNSDYTEESNRTETIRVGQRAGTISIPIIDDIRNEGNETFTLKLSNVVGASGFGGNAQTFSQTVTIIDNEPPKLSIANTELNVLENVESGKLVLEAMLSGSREDGNPSTTRRATFTYALTNDTATKGVDYTEVQQSERTITFEEGETTKTFEIPILDDSANPIAEGNETFDITMTISTGAVFEGGRNMDTQTITIHDNELPTLSFETTEISGNENIEDAEIDVNVNLSVVTHQDVTFQYDLSDVSATKGADYFEKGTREVTISAGNSSGDIFNSNC